MQTTTVSTQRFLRPGRVLVTLLLLISVAISALAVIDSTHRSRELFNEWQQLQRREWALEEDWERLLLEQSTWAAHERVSQIAESKLDMTLPDPVAIKVVSP
ncbi:MAG TPA: cell division protein FtsL [Spongiibacteraceae bacterium]|nr:cell division protein FtsL [Spongiibacteraceae bacterium]